jgi:hypothetical protein
LFLDATSARIVAEATERVKLRSGAAVMVFRFSVRGNLHDKHGYRRKQNNVNHAAFLKENAQNKPDKEKARRDKPEFHESFSETLVFS